MSAERQEGERHKEQQPEPYYLASRFSGEQPAGLAYFKAQGLIFNTPESELSVFRFQLNSVYHVAVLGDQPPHSVIEHIERILATGERVPLPPDILLQMTQRRVQAKRVGSWVERHYRPGKRFEP